MCGRENQVGATVLLTACIAGLSPGRRLWTQLQRGPCPGPLPFPILLSPGERSGSLLSSKVPPLSDRQGELRACSPGTIVSAGHLRATQSWICSSTFKPCPPPTLLLSLGHHGSPKRLYPQDVGLGRAGVGDGGTPPQCLSFPQGQCEFIQCHPQPSLSPTPLQVACSSSVGAPWATAGPCSKGEAWGDAGEKCGSAPCPRWGRVGDQSHIWMLWEGTRANHSGLLGVPLVCISVFAL